MFKWMLLILLLGCSSSLSTFIKKEDCVGIRSYYFKVIDKLEHGIMLLSTNNRTMYFTNYQIDHAFLKIDCEAYENEKQ